MKAKLLLLAISAMSALVGCGPATIRGQVPHPMLPQTIQLHRFTGTRVFGQTGGITGIEARAQAIDSFGDATKAFGTFRFELHSYRPHQADNRGRRLGVWAVDLTDPEANLLHWDSISRTYRFALAWDEPIPVGKKFVLSIIYSQPEGPRLFDSDVFVSGE